MLSHSALRMGKKERLAGRHVAGALGLADDFAALLEEREGAAEEPDLAGLPGLAPGCVEQRVMRRRERVGPLPPPRRPLAVRVPERRAVDRDHGRWRCPVCAGGPRRCDQREYGARPRPRPRATREAVHHRPAFRSPSAAPPCAGSAMHRLLLLQTLCCQGLPTAATFCQAPSVTLRRAAPASPPRAWRPVPPPGAGVPVSARHSRRAGLSVPSSSE